MAFKYRERSDQEWEKRRTQQGGEFEGIFKDDFKVFKSTKGENYIRILPPTWDDPVHYGIDVWVHYGVGPDAASVICNSKMGLGKCPLCEARATAQRAGDETLADELKPGRRVLVYLLNRNDRDESAGPLLWAMSWGTDRDIAKITKDRRTGQLFQIDHPTRGYDVSFEREGEGKKTKYTGWQLARESSSVDNDVLDYIEAFPLPDTLLHRSYDEVLDLYEGKHGARNSTRERAPSRDEAPREEPPPPRDERDYGRRDAERGSDDRAPPREREPIREREPVREREQTTREPIRERDVAAAEEQFRRREPEPERTRTEEPPPRSSSPSSRAEELRAKFSRK